MYIKPNVDIYIYGYFLIKRVIVYLPTYKICSTLNFASTAFMFKC